MEKSGEHGMKLIMTFPAYAESMLEQKHLKYPIVIIKEGMENLPVLIRVFQNLAITPYIVQEVTDLNENEFPMSTMIVIVGAKALVTRFKNISHYPRICIVSQFEENLYILDHGRGNRAEIFSEEYVLSNLIHKRHMAPRAKLQERKSVLTSN
jgi:hypothetical protein